MIGEGWKFPDANASVVVSTQGKLAVGRNSDGKMPSSRFGEGRDNATLAQVPEQELASLVGRDEVAAVGEGGQAVDPVDGPTLERARGVAVEIPDREETAFGAGDRTPGDSLRRSRPR